MVPILLPCFYLLLPPNIFSPILLIRAPKTVENFSVHSRNGYYNGLLFHRVIKGFVIQGGDPNGINASF